MIFWLLYCDSQSVYGLILTQSRLELRTENAINGTWIEPGDFKMFLNLLYLPVSLSCHNDSPKSET